MEQNRSIKACKILAILRKDMFIVTATKQKGGIEVVPGKAELPIVISSRNLPVLHSVMNDHIGLKVL